MRISKRDYLLIGQYISEEDFSLEKLDIIIAKEQTKLNNFLNYLTQIKEQDQLEIKIINQVNQVRDAEIENFKRFRRKFSIDESVARKNRFRSALERLIRISKSDLDILLKIRRVFVDYLPESVQFPSSPRSKLEASPARFKSPKLSPR